MKNITLSFDEELLIKARTYANKRGMSVNKLIRQLVSQIVGSKKKAEFEELFELADKAKPRSNGKRWKREDLYDV